MFQDKKKIRYIKIVSTLFIVVFILHFLRIINKWDFVISGYQVPMWISWVAVVLLGYLVIRGLSYGNK